jgi:hypothetical protein
MAQKEHVQRVSLAGISPLTRNAVFPQRQLPKIVIGSLREMATAHTQQVARVCHTAGSGDASPNRGAPPTLAGRREY